MPTLEAPDGTRYATDNEAEIRNLTLGHGYRVLAEGDPEPQQEPETADDDTDEDQDDALV